MRYGLLLGLAGSRPMTAREKSSRDPRGSARRMRSEARGALRLSRTSRSTTSSRAKASRASEDCWRRARNSSSSFSDRASPRYRAIRSSRSSGLIGQHSLGLQALSDGRPRPVEHHEHPGLRPAEPLGDLGAREVGEVERLDDSPGVLLEPGHAIVKRLEGVVSHPAGKRFQPRSHLLFDAGAVFPEERMFAEPAAALVQGQVPGHSPDPGPEVRPGAVLAELREGRDERLLSHVLDGGVVGKQRRKHYPDRGFAGLDDGPIEIPPPLEDGRDGTIDLIWVHAWFSVSLCTPGTRPIRKSTTRPLRRSEDPGADGVGAPGHPMPR